MECYPAAATYDCCLKSWFAATACVMMTQNIRESPEFSRCLKHDYISSQGIILSTCSGLVRVSRIYDTCLGSRISLSVRLGLSQRITSCWSLMCFRRSLASKRRLGMTTCCSLQLWDDMSSKWLALAERAMLPAL